MRLLPSERTIIAPTDKVALEALMPDRWTERAHPEHRLEQRKAESRKAQALRRRKRVCSSYRLHT